MNYRAKSVLGEDWLKTFTNFRLNPDAYFEKTNITREAFCLDILKDIYLDNIDNNCKIGELLILQEHSSSLIKDSNLLEQIVGSLINLFNVIKNNDEMKLLRSQILITVSTILLTNGTEDDGERLVKSVKDMLMGVILEGVEDPVVISSACQSLQEIEVFFPNILESEMPKILTSCEKHLSPAFQNYALLLSLCVKNKCSKLKEYPNDENETFSYGHNTVQVPLLVSYLLELIPLMSPISVYTVLKNLLTVVQNTESISPVVFKLFLPNVLFSGEVLYIHLAFDFLEAFKGELFTVQEEKFLMRQLILLSSHPCLSMSHRMLYSDWLKSCLMQKDRFSSPFPALPNLLPGPFDGPVTQEKKSFILALYVPQSADKTVDFLNECISGLKKCALLPGGRKAAASFFRTLFAYFSTHNADYMHNYLYKLILGIMKTSPHLLQYALGFLSSVITVFPESKFPKEVLSHMVDHILSLPTKQFLNNLECYLIILEQASEVCGSECKPRSILRLLQSLLVECNSYQQKRWEFGNNVLSVCLAIFKFHDVQLFYYDLAEVLCLISQNVDDVDVKDRAKIYYCALTSLSKLKVQSVFKVQSPKIDHRNDITSFVPGVNATLQFASSVQTLPKPVLQLTRKNKKHDAAPEQDTEALLPIPNNIDVLAVYKNYVNSTDFSVSFPLVLKHVSDSEKSFSVLYGVVITAESTPKCKQITEIKIPVFKATETEKDNIIDVSIMPYESQPLDLQFKIEFNCSNGFSYICYPDPLYLTFEDFFLSLPIPPELKNVDESWKRYLFESLWKEFEEKTRCKDSDYCKSAFCLNLNKDDLPLIIEEYFQKFLISRSDEFPGCIAIFLPPKSHLLMKINIINNKPFINILVDNVLCLPYIALYLQDLNIAK